ncbi:MAG TPA: class I SAM-dependent methyltransferase [Bryobacteraceae bacterium]|jgi:ubiquinone/menaquinone biosynthesis C-methylase UbiE|nr:class I SAM-dependent methyltransferase [Bryobacteraceae bacterium]
MIKPLLKEFEAPILTITRDNRLPRTIAGKTRRIYDILSTVYPLSTYCFHSKAHKMALEVSGIRNGMRVLEVATGSGEMFRRLVRTNRHGATVGVDLSPNMASKTFRQVRAEYPDATSHCQAVDARYLPFADGAYDAVVCCYLLELLSTPDIALTLEEIRRVLRPGGTLTLVNIGLNGPIFTQLYRIAGSLAPAFWGRSVDGRVDDLVRACRLQIYDERHVCQRGYHSRVLAARKG